MKQSTCRHTQLFICALVKTGYGDSPVASGK